MPVDRQTDPIPVVDRQTDPIPVVDWQTDPVPVVDRQTDPVPVVDRQTDPVPVVDRQTDPVPVGYPPPHVNDKGVEKKKKNENQSAKLAFFWHLRPKSNIL